VLASLDVNRMPAAAPAPQAAAAAAERQAPQLDEGRVQALTTILESDPKNVNAVVQLGSVYLEAERFDEAEKWFQEGLRIDPKSADASTQLGMTYFFTKGPDPALAQFEHSLSLNPKHPRTLLNKGIVLWRGKQDLKGAEAAWTALVEAAPNSPEAEAAKQGLQAISGAARAESPTSNQ
jgi:tetratricopeptide (TPR) repeat protein